MPRKRLPKAPGPPSLLDTFGLLRGSGPWHEDLEHLRLPTSAKSLLDGTIERPWLRTNRFALLDSRLSLFTPQELDDADAELDRLVRAFGPVLNASGDLAYARKRRVPNDVSQYMTSNYLSDRSAFFGGAMVYNDYLASCCDELNSDGGRLRNQVDPTILSKKELARRHSGGRLEPDWREAQNVFYAWVRRAYELENGPGSSLAYAIRQGKSERLSAALQRVRASTNLQFQAGGYNARPKKKPGGYRLGTLSEHATGSAIDIDATRNAQLDNWEAIERYTGISLPHSTRASLWKTAPQQLHASITQMNNTFVSKLQLSVSEQSSQGGDPLEAAHKSDTALQGFKLAWLKNWRHGFFDLSWALVEALKKEGFTWGATFKTPDLHHFEISTP